MLQVINEIIKGINQAIRQEFGRGFTIYTESVSQNLKEPCFFVFCINPTSNRFLGTRFKRTHQFMIQYIPATNEGNRECNDVSERLFQCLETITAQGELTRGTNLASEIVDDVLNLQVNYDMFINKVEAKDNAMGSYSVQTKVREDDENGN